jgi:hypothetical protein
LHVEEEADRLLLDPVHHRFEQLEALALVLHERVALGHRAQADALLEVVHLVEVLAPLAVQHREHDAALDLTHDLLAQGLSGAGRRRGGRRSQLLEERLARDRRPATGAGRRLRSTVIDTGRAPRAVHSRSRSQSSE